MSDEKRDSWVLTHPLPPWSQVQHRRGLHRSCRLRERTEAPSAPLNRTSGSASRSPCADWLVLCTSPTHSALPQAAIVVLASHNKGKLEELVLGSTTQYCTHNCSQPVLVVRY